jgi:toxin-antitoxin system PIN domain toxin
MSYGLDANILVYASNRESPRYRRAQAFLADCIANPEPICLAWSTLSAYLRLTTHAGIFTEPLTPTEAETNIDRLLSLPNVRVIVEREGFWAEYRATTAGHLPRGKLVPDFHLATLLRQHDIRTFYTADRDFLRFDFLDARDPFRGDDPRH